jgi:hypothetical protein
MESMTHVDPLANATLAEMDGLVAEGRAGKGRLAEAAARCVLEVEALGGDRRALTAGVATALDDRVLELRARAAALRG